EARFDRLRRPILDEVGELLDELRRAPASEIVALRKREDLLELIEDQKRRERASGRIAQHVATMMQKLPQRFAGHRDADMRPFARRVAFTEDRLLDLLGRRRCFTRI